MCLVSLGQVYDAKSQMTVSNKNHEAAVVNRDGRAKLAS